MDEPTYEWSTLGNRLKTLRKMRGYSQDDVADRLGISVGKLRDFEYGRRPMTVDVLVALAHLFEVSIEFLATGKEVNLDLCIWRLQSPGALRWLPRGIQLHLRYRRNLPRQCPRRL